MKIKIKEKTEKIIEQEVDFPIYLKKIGIPQYIKLEEKDNKIIETSLMFFAISVSISQLEIKKEMAEKIISEYTLCKSSEFNDNFKAVKKFVKNIDEPPSKLYHTKEAEPEQNGKYKCLWCGNEHEETEMNEEICVNCYSSDDYMLNVIQYYINSDLHDEDKVAKIKAYIKSINKEL